MSFTFRSRESRRLAINPYIDSVFIILYCSFNPTNNVDNVAELSRNNNHDDVQLNNQINATNSSLDYSNDVEMENGHITNGEWNHHNNSYAKSVNQVH